MERRFIAWLAISFGLLILYINLFAPPPAPPELAEDDAEQVEGDGAGRPGADEAERPGVAPEGLPPEPAEEEPPPAAAPLPPAGEVPLEFITLGSVDPESPYRMLLTLTNEGAAVLRAELADPKYRDLHDRAGYIGSLEPADAAGGGAKVRAIGAGTPAAEAGLQPGDVIKAVGELPIETAADFRAALSATKPWQTITLQAVRDGEPLDPMAIRLVRPPQEVMRPEWENVLSRDGEAVEPFDAAHSFLLTLNQIGERQLDEGQAELPGVDLKSGRWEIVERSETEVLFRRILPDLSLEVTKSYRLALQEPADGERGGPAYHFEMDISIRNLGAQPRSLAYQLDGPTGLPTEGWWYINRIGRGWFESSGLRDVVARFEGRPTWQFSASTIAEEEDDLQGGTPLVYAGVDSIYFASVLVPQKEELSDLWFEDIKAVLLEPKLDPSDNLALSNVTCRLIGKPVTLEPDQFLRNRFTVFCGPKQPAFLAHYQPAGQPEYALDDLVYYGWFWWVAKPMLGILSFFYSIVGNYGIAIIMLTVLVRACMLPLSLKQARNMAKMQELQPEMQRIAEKYKSDMEKRARAQQELFRKHNYNPLGGCLMAFVQLPIFVGLYRGLMLDIDLRQAPLFTETIRWCSNLGAPDMLLDWSDWMPAFIQGFLGPYLNILPIFTIFLFLLQQKLFMPEPTNEQAALQQKVMKFMMIFIGFLFYKVASGLCLYFIASSIWGIAERKLIIDPAKAKQTPATAPAGGDSTAAAKKERAGAERARPGRNGHPKDKSRSKARRRK